MHLIGSVVSRGNVATGKDGIIENDMLGSECCGTSLCGE